MAGPVDWIVRWIIEAFRVPEEDARKWVFGAGCALTTAIASFLWKRVPYWLHQLWDQVSRARRYEKAYLKQLAAACRYVQVQGIPVNMLMPVELDSVYLSLRLVQDAADSLQLAEAAQRSGRRLLIVGPPGSGKTTLLTWVARRLASGDHRQLGFPRPLLPVLLTLRDIDASGGGRLTLDNIERAAIPGALADTRPPPDHFIRLNLERGRCIVLVDGLDEVGSDEERMQVVDELEGIVDAFDRNWYVITSRLPGVKGTQPAGFATATLSDLSDEDIHGFCRAWFLSQLLTARDPQTEEDRREAGHLAERSAARLSDAILDPANEALRRLASTPLLLTIIAIVHQYLGNLPARRVELYRHVSHALLGGVDGTRGLRWPVDHDTVARVMEQLAYSMHIAGVLGLSKGKLERELQSILESLQCKLTYAQMMPYLCERAGVIREGAPDEYQFSHATFQEYFTARHLRRTHGEDAWRFLGGRIGEPWWRETILLYAADGNSGQLLDRLLSLGADDEACIALAAHVLAEAPTQMVPDALGLRVADAVIDALECHPDMGDQVHSQLADAAMAIARSGASEPAAIHITCFLMARSLGRGISPTPVALDDLPWASTALLRLLEESVPEQRLPIIDLLSGLNDDVSLRALAHFAATSDVADQIVPVVCALATRGCLPDDLKIALPVDRAEWLSYRCRLRCILTGIIKTVTMLSSDQPVTRRALAGIAGDLALTLRDGARDCETDAATSAVSTFSHAHERAIVDDLVALLRDDDKDVSRSAVYALAAMETGESLSELRSRLQDGAGDTSVRVLAAVALGNLRDREAEPILADCLADQSHLVRYAASNALHKIGTPQCLAAADAGSLSHSPFRP